MSQEERGRGGSKRACCMISELLEESGIDRQRLRAVRRQVLQGIILLCEWQLQRMEEPRSDPAAPPPPRRGRRVAVE